MCTFPIILEQICRHTPNPPDEMERFRRAWAAVEGVIIIDPAIYPQKKDGKFLPNDMLYDAFPSMKMRPTQRYTQDGYADSKLLSRS